MWIRVAEVLFISGLAAQGWGVYEAHGIDTMAAVIGTEVALIGLIGVMRSAG